MKLDTAKIIKGAVAVVGIGVTLLTNYFADKDLDNKVAEKVNEALAKQSNE
jgi:hypothetical protein